MARKRGMVNDGVGVLVSGDGVGGRELVVVREMEIELVLG